MSMKVKRFLEKVKQEKHSTSLLNFPIITHDDDVTLENLNFHTYRSREENLCAAYTNNRFFMFQLEEFFVFPSESFIGKREATVEKHMSKL